MSLTPPIGGVQKIKRKRDEKKRNDVIVKEGRTHHWTESDKRLV